MWVDSDGFVGRLAKGQGIAHECSWSRRWSGSGLTTGRMRTPEEVARLITFLASPNNITGNEYLIDGGLIKTV